MIIKTKGIVFRAVKFKESSLILDIYTRDLGMRTYIVSGVRKNKARFSAAGLQVMSQVDLVAYEKDNKDIHRIKEVKPAHIYHSLVYDIKKVAIGQFIIEIARKSIREKEANIQVYDFLSKTLLFLDSSKESITSIHLSFLVHFSSLLGFNPEQNFSDSKPFFDMREGSFVHQAPFHKDYFGLPGSELLNLFLNCPMEAVHTLPIERLDRSNLLDHLVTYFRIHSGDFGPLKSLQIFQDIFSV